MRKQYYNIFRNRKKKISSRNHKTNQKLLCGIQFNDHGSIKKERKKIRKKEKQKTSGYKHIFHYTTIIQTKWNGRISFKACMTVLFLSFAFVYKNCSSSSLKRRMKLCNYKGYPHLLRSLVKKGCLRASLALSRSAGSYRRSPWRRSIKSPAEWSTCCIIKFWNQNKK